MSFANEAEFETALIQLLTSSYGWEPEVLEYKTEADLLRNWADILFENNRHIDRLDKYPLTDGEMAQIIEQITKLKTPLLLNGFINGRTISITRDNPADIAHYGKEVSLKIYDRQEIAAGQSRYQIARQPKFAAKSSLLPQRRGDFLLLINGMPVFHVELKKSGVPLSQACAQIEKYAHEGVFTGLFSLVQVFVVMTPEQTLYYANPGPEGVFNPCFYFHWADFNNDPVNDWKQIASQLLSIPMAHQMIGYYTVPDKNDGVLKVMRSYQCRAAMKISDAVARHKWETGSQRGGHVWHTTGSGKTLTSFKSAQLIAQSQDADKVVFLIDRIELGTQSAGEYRGFADDTESVQETEDTATLIDKLRSTDTANTLIVTSIQKMSNITNEDTSAAMQADIAAIGAKRIVFIVDECHRSTFGDMMHTIKKTFPRALFFGFSGTPILQENQKHNSITADVFGDELHRYSIADGIRDRNVLGFDPIKVLTFTDMAARRAVALEKAKAPSEQAALADPAKSVVYYRYMQDVPMAGQTAPDGKYEKGIEDYLLESGIYRTEEHRRAVAADISENWLLLSHNHKFHAILATSSIPEAVAYYRLFKQTAPDLHVAALFDNSLNSEDAAYGIAKEEALLELIQDYNARYGQSFSLATWAGMKKDIQYRLGHKYHYARIEHDRKEQIDLLIVVDQMLTGYDSKWINALYLDKLLRYETIIQAFSRTNRLFGPDKPFGTVKYYRAPHSMDRNIKAAVKLYSGDRPLELFVPKLGRNLGSMNAVFVQITNVFVGAGVQNFSTLPPETEDKKQFALLFRSLNEHLAAAKIQGFMWAKLQYAVRNETTGKEEVITVPLDEQTFQSLHQRYAELFAESGGGGGKGDSPYDLDPFLTTISTGHIDAAYMEQNFDKYKKHLSAGDAAQKEQAKAELHRSFASLTQEQQKYANIFLHDIETGDVTIEPGRTLVEYINEYMERAKDDRIHRLAAALGLDESMLREMMGLNLTEKTLNEFGQLDDLKATVDKAKAQAYFAAKEEASVPLRKVHSKVDALLRNFILSGGTI